MSADQGAQLFDQIDYIHKNTFFLMEKSLLSKPYSGA